MTEGPPMRLCKPSLARTAGTPGQAVDSALVTFPAFLLPLDGAAAPSQPVDERHPLIQVEGPEQLVEDDICELDGKGSDGSSTMMEGGGVELESKGVGSKSKGEESEEDLGLMVGLAAVGGCTEGGDTGERELRRG